MGIETIIIVLGVIIVVGILAAGRGRRAGKNGPNPSSKR
jgi:hypothetical protein